MHSEKRSAAFLLVAMAVLGLTVGIGGTVVAAHQGVGRLHYHAERPQRGPNEYLDKLTRDLELTAEQRDSISSILERQRGDIDAIWREVRPRFDSLRTNVRAEMRVLLNPDQQARFDEISRQNDQRRNRGNSR